MFSLVTIILLELFFRSTFPRRSLQTFWCLLTNIYGSLEIYSLPYFKEVFSCPNFSNAPKLLIDHESAKQNGNR